MKILVIRFKQIGDAVLSSPICTTLKKTFPNAQIDYVLYEHIAPLFENHNGIDNVIKITKEEQKNIFKYVVKVWKVTRNNYDIIIDIMSTPKSELFTLFSRKSKYKIGRFKKNRGWSYTDKILEPQNSKNKIDKFLQMLKPLAKEYDIKYDETLSVDITEAEEKSMREKMEMCGVDFKKNIVAFAINSRVPQKVFNIDKMLKVIEKLLKESDIQILFYYSPEEKEFALKGYEKLGKPSNIFVNIETKNIRELAMLFKNCQMFIGNEGGPRHIAHAVGIPTFVVCRPNLDTKEWLIAGEKHMHFGPLDVSKDAYKLSPKEQEELMSVSMIVDKIKEFYQKYKKF